MATLGDVIDVLEAAYPPSLAEDWDTGIGLTCGDRDEPVDHVLLAVDVDPATVAEAQRVGAQLLLTHHPLLFRPVQSVAADTERGGLVHRMIRAGIAHFAAHTNADKAVGGVNDALAEALGLGGTRPLAPERSVDGSPSSAVGLGRIGTVADGLTLGAVVDLVAGTLPAVAGGIRVSGDLRAPVRTVAVCGGSGGSLLGRAAAAGADVYVTSELGHHAAGEFRAVPGRPALIEVAHFAGEWPWLDRAAAVLTRAFDGSVACTVSTLCTDPWGVHVDSRPSSEPRWSV